MSERATQPPKPFRKPEHWTTAPPPVPEIPASDSEQLSPTRYGDWVRKGIAIDF